MAPEHAMLLQGTPCCSRVLHCSIGCYSTAADTTSTAGDAISTAGDANLLQGMQTITPADTTLIQGIWPLNYLTYHTIWLQNMMLLQGTPCCSRVLHCSIGCYSTAADTTSTAGDAISTAGDANNYPSGYHTNTGYMAFELSHISYHMAPEHAMLLQGTPCCSRVLHCSIGCYSTAADTTSTAGDAISTAGDANNYPSGYHTNTGYYGL